MTDAVATGGNDFPRLRRGRDMGNQDSSSPAIKHGENVRIAA